MDFGFEPHYENADEHNWYLAPNEGPSAKSDIFAAGVIFYQLLTGLLPEWKKGLLQANEAFSEVPQHLRTVIKGMLCLDQDVRTESFEKVKQGLHLSELTSSDTPNQPVESNQGPKRRKGGLKKAALALSLLLLLAINGGLYGWLLLKKGAEKPQTGKVKSLAPVAAEQKNSGAKPLNEQELVMKPVSNP